MGIAGVVAGSARLAPNRNSSAGPSTLARARDPPSSPSGTGLGAAFHRERNHRLLTNAPAFINIGDAVPSPWLRGAGVG